MLAHSIFISGLCLGGIREPFCPTFESSLSMIYADPEQENASKIRLDPELSV
jgi:hypothetical protein